MKKVESHWSRYLCQSVFNKKIDEENFSVREGLVSKPFFFFDINSSYSFLEINPNESTV